MANRVSEIETRLKEASKKPSYSVEDHLWEDIAYLLKIVRAADGLAEAFVHVKRVDGGNCLGCIEAEKALFAWQKALDA